MNSIKSDANDLLNNIVQTGILPLFKEDLIGTYVKDPYFNIKRNRVISEIIQSLIQANLGTKEEIEQLCKFLIHTQKENGCWHEIHPNYNQPSALITSFVADSLITALKTNKTASMEDTIHKAKNYVLSQELRPGYFLKSSQYTADHLNVDASCGAFLAHYGKFFNDEACLNAAIRTAEHIVHHQWKNGVYPYTINKGNYPEINNLPCMHYQAITLFYLIKIHEILEENWLQQSLLDGGNWLRKMQKQNGSFHWEKSGLLFAYYLTGSYAFATNSFYYLSQYDKTFLDYAQNALEILKQNRRNGLFLRWEKANWLTLPFSFTESFSTSLIGKHTIRKILFRFGYASYRQISRRRIKHTIDTTLFTHLTNFLKMNPSTVEPFNNYPDLFMTSEILNALSSLKP